MFEIMERESLDALIASSPANVVYSSEFWCVYHWMQLANVFVILSNNGTLESTLLIPTSIADLFCADHFPVNDTRCFGPGSGEPADGSQQTSNLRDWQIKLDFLRKSAKTNLTGIELLVETIKDKGLARKRLGLDEKGVCSRDRRKVTKLLPHAKIVKAGDLFREIRMVKTQEEIARLRRAAEISERAISTALESAH
jgi:Xaa-Pro aminopeptidase